MKIMKKTKNNTILNKKISHTLFYTPLKLEIWSLWIKGRMETVNRRYLSQSLSSNRDTQNGWNDLDWNKIETKVKTFRRK